VEPAILSQIGGQLAKSNWQMAQLKPDSNIVSIQQSRIELLAVLIANC
jgi:hypothetical protein